MNQTFKLLLHEYERDVAPEHQQKFTQHEAM